MVSGVVKSFNVSFDYVLYDLSFTNAQLYCASLPTLSSKSKKGEKDKGEVINGDDPRNNDMVDKFCG